MGVNAERRGGVNKKKKLGKGRLDTFYHLAKDHGYRSRAAFKLIQLNKKYNFLGSARSCVDLCAAPGGWLQVAAKYMPVNSIIIGVDLQEIRPIRNVIVFQDDITKPSCSKTIHGHLKGGKIDVCLYDGAPNMGTAWSQDAYDQVDLTLKALKLATQVLKQGGWFVAKVFRSGDYNALLWVFNQLFKTVDSTKPMASRNTSAEIYVVCQGYLAPTKLDPKLLDSKFVFKQDDPNVAKPTSLNQLTETKQKRFRQGYDRENIFRKATITEFLNCEDPIRLLSENYLFEFDAESKKYLDHPLMNEIVKKACEDLKVLGKGEFKALLKWRLAIKKEQELSGKPSEEEEEEEEEGEEEESRGEEGDDLESKHNALLKKEKREKKKKLDTKRKTLKKFQLGMAIKGDVGIGVDDNGQLFNSRSAAGISEEDADRINEMDLDEDAFISESEGEEDEYAAFDEEDGEKITNRIDRMEREIEIGYDLYVSNINKKRKALVDKSKVDSDDVDEYEGRDAELKIEDDDDDESDGALLRKSKKNPLLLEEAGPSKNKKIDMWYSQDIFKGVGDDDLDMADFAATTKRKAEKTHPDEASQAISKKSKSNDGTAVGTANGKANGKANGASAKANGFYDEPDGRPNKKTKETDFEVVPMEPDMKQLSSDEEDEEDDEDEDADSGDEFYLNKEELEFEEDAASEDDEDNLDEGDQVEDNEYDLFQKSQALAIGTAMLRKKKREDIMDDMFNRYAFADDDLPGWFTANESKHTKPNLPITKEDVEEIRRQYKEINSRPIKKVAEARARKHKRALMKVSKARAKAHNIAKDDSLTPGQKISQVNKIMKKATQKQGREKVYMVARKSSGIQKGKHAKHGRVKIVDGRLKKDTRAEKAKSKWSGKVRDKKGKSRGREFKAMGKKNKK